MSVVVPAHNAAQTVAETLQSVIAQTHEAWEAIVVDDGSTDSTATIAREFTDRHPRILLLRQPQAGEAGARNAGLDLARHEWVLFLDSDDWIAPTHLERLTAELAANPGLDAVHCGSARVALDGTITVERYQPPSGDLFAVLARRAAFPVHACLVRRSLVEAVGRFDPSLRKSPDWDLWQRIARTGARFGAVPEVLAFYRSRPNASSLEAVPLFRDGMRVLRQGHSPDPRVPNPHPLHAQGEPPELVRTQQFYLLCWCAGLLLGRGEDARPLLELVPGEDYPELYPEAVARCIFDAAPLPSGGSPSGWEALWPRVRHRIYDFLVALEACTQAPDLQPRATDQLKRLILLNTPAWEPIVRALDQAAKTEAAAAGDLRGRLAVLEGQLAATERGLVALAERADSAAAARVEERAAANDLRERLAVLEGQLAATERGRVALAERADSADGARAEQSAALAELRQQIQDLEGSLWMRIGRRLHLVAPTTKEPV